MDLAQHGDEALVVDELFLGGERLAAAELFEHVVNAGECEAGMLLLLPLAVRIEPLAEGAGCLSGDSEKSFQPVLELQSRHFLEILDVAGEKDRIVFHDDAGDSQVHRADPHALLA